MVPTGKHASTSSRSASTNSHISNGTITYNRKGKGRATEPVVGRKESKREEAGELLGCVHCPQAAFGSRDEQKEHKRLRHQLKYWARVKRDDGTTARLKVSRTSGTSSSGPRCWAPSCTFFGSPIYRSSQLDSHASSCPLVQAALSTLGRMDDYPAYDKCSKPPAVSSASSCTAPPARTDGSARQSSSTSTSTHMTKPSLSSFSYQTSPSPASTVRPQQTASSSRNCPPNLTSLPLTFTRSPPRRTGSAKPLTLSNPADSSSISVSSSTSSHDPASSSPDAGSDFGPFSKSNSTKPIPPSSFSSHQQHFFQPTKPSPLSRPLVFSSSSTSLASETSSASTARKTSRPPPPSESKPSSTRAQSTSTTQSPKRLRSRSPPQSQSARKRRSIATPDFDFASSASYHPSPPDPLDSFSRLDDEVEELQRWHDQEDYGINGWQEEDVEIIDEDEEEGKESTRDERREEEEEEIMNSTQLRSHARDFIDLTQIDADNEENEVDEEGFFNDQPLHYPPSPPLPPLQPFPSPVSTLSYPPNPLSPPSLATSQPRPQPNSPADADAEEEEEGDFPPSSISTFETLRWECSLILPSSPLRTRSAVLRVTLAAETDEYWLACAYTEDEATGELGGYSWGEVDLEGVEFDEVGFVASIDSFELFRLRFDGREDWETFKTAYHRFLAPSDAARPSDDDRQQHLDLAAVEVEEEEDQEEELMEGEDEAGMKKLEETDRSATGPEISSAISIDAAHPAQPSSDPAPRSLELELSAIESSILALPGRPSSCLVIVEVASISSTSVLPPSTVHRTTHSCRLNSPPLTDPTDSTLLSLAPPIVLSLPSAIFQPIPISSASNFEPSSFLEPGIPPSSFLVIRFHLLGFKASDGHALVCDKSSISSLIWQERKKGNLAEEERPFSSPERDLVLVERGSGEGDDLVFCDDSQGGGEITLARSDLFAESVKLEASVRWSVEEVPLSASPASGQPRHSIPTSNRSPASQPEGNPPIDAPFPPDPAFTNSSPTAPTSTASTTASASSPPIQSHADLSEIPETQYPLAAVDDPLASQPDPTPGVRIGMSLDEAASGEEGSQKFDVNEGGRAKRGGGGLEEAIREGRFQREKVSEEREDEEEEEGIEDDVSLSNSPALQQTRSQSQAQPSSSFLLPNPLNDDDKDADAHIIQSQGPNAFFPSSAQTLSGTDLEPGAEEEMEGLMVEREAESSLGIVAQSPTQLGKEVRSAEGKDLVEEVLDVGERLLANGNEMSGMVESSDSISPFKPSPASVRSRMIPTAPTALSPFPSTTSIASSVSSSALNSSVSPPSTSIPSPLPTLPHVATSTLTSATPPHIPSSSPPLQPGSFYNSPPRTSLSLSLRSQRLEGGSLADLFPLLNAEEVELREREAGFDVLNDEGKVILKGRGSSERAGRKEREEDIFEFEEMHDGQKMMMCLWNRWVQKRGPMHKHNCRTHMIGFIDRYFKWIDQYNLRRHLVVHLKVLNSFDHLDLETFSFALKHYGELKKETERRIFADLKG